MKRTIFAATALAALSLTACKKKDTDTTGTTTPGPMYLKKITETENGTTRVFTFTYDNQHRLLKYATADNSAGTEFTYDAAGNLTKVKQTEPGVRNEYAYTYSNGKPVSATFKSWNTATGGADVLDEDDVLTYTVTGSKVTGIHLDMLQDQSDMDFTLSYNADGEATQIKDSNGAFYTANFTYGSHKSAMPAVSPWVLDQAGFSLHFVSRHELTTATYDFPGTMLDRTETASYTFNAAGYPVTSTKGTLTTTFEYE